MGNNEPVIDLEDPETTPLLRRVIVSSLGGLFFEGYILSITNVALGAMDSDLILDAHWNGLLGVSALAGLSLGASLGGWFTDPISRYKMFITDSVITAILSTLCALAHTPLTLVTLRFFVGIVAGADHPIATSMITEFSPRKYRAAAMGIIAAARYLGANVAAPAGFTLINTNHGQRYMLVSSAVPCILTLVGRWNIPESPRWLVSRGWNEKAQCIIHETLGANVRLPEAKEVVKTLISKVLQGVYLQRIIFVGVIWLRQATSMFALYTYGPQIIAAVGLGEGRNVLLDEFPIDTFFMLGTFLAMYLCEKIGRRPLIITCFGGTTVALTIIDFFPSAGIGLIMGCFVSYALLLGGPGNLKWLHPSELFPTEIRATAVGFAMAFSRIDTVVSIHVLPGFTDNHGIGKTMFAGALISALGFGVPVIWAPKTREYTLAETGSVDFKGR